MKIQVVGRLGRLLADRLLRLEVLDEDVHMIALHAEAIQSLLGFLAVRNAVGGIQLLIRSCFLTPAWTKHCAFD